MSVNSLQRLYGFQGTLLIVLAITLVRLAYLYVSDIGLFYDEAQYWTWSKDFSFGYYSKPPVIAWLIGLTTAGCGDTTFCVRFGAPIVHGCVAMLVYSIAHKAYHTNRVAFWSTMTYLTLPAVTLSSFFISSDVPLMLFWALALLLFIKALENEQDKPWVYLGLILGLGMLSKYTMLIFYLSMGLAMLIIGVYRKHLISIPHILAIFISVIVFFPNFFWNASHQFVSIGHTGENVFASGLKAYPDQGFIFLLSQVGVFGPIMFAVLLYVSGRLFRSGKTEQDRLMFIFTFTLFLIGTGVGFMFGAQAHWIAPAYIAGTIVVVHFLIEKGWIKWLVVSLGLHSVVMILFFMAYPLVGMVADDKGPFARLERWNQLAKPASAALHHYPQSLLLADERKAVATLMYNLRSADGKPYPVLKWNADGVVQDHYDLTTDMNGYVGHNFILVTRSSDITGITRYFDRMEKIVAQEPLPEGFALYYLENFHGYNQ